MAGIGPVATPAPERLTACGPPLTLPPMNSDAVRIPASDGVKITCMVQLVEAASAEPQLFVCAKSLLFRPPIATALRFTVAALLLVNVTVCAPAETPMVWFPKFRLVADNVGA